MLSTVDGRKQDERELNTLVKRTGLFGPSALFIESKYMSWSCVVVLRFSLGQVSLF